MHNITSFPIKRWGIEYQILVIGLNRSDFRGMHVQEMRPCPSLCRLRDTHLRQDRRELLDPRTKNVQTMLFPQTTGLGERCQTRAAIHLHYF